MGWILWGYVMWTWSWLKSWVRPDSPEPRCWMHSAGMSLQKDLGVGGQHSAVYSQASCSMLLNRKHSMLLFTLHILRKKNHSNNEIQILVKHIAGEPGNLPQWSLLGFAASSSVNRKVSFSEEADGWAEVPVLPMVVVCVDHDAAEAFMLQKTVYDTTQDLDYNTTFGF